MKIAHCYNATVGDIVKGNCRVYYETKQERNHQIHRATEKENVKGTK